MVRLALPLILASGSPRRKELLSAMGLEYIVDVSDVDENTSGAPADMVVELSGRKARAVAQRHPNAVILAADTLVYGNGEVLGKPQSPEHAIAMLSQLSDSWHEVYTGITLINTATGRCLQKADCTKVHFIQLTMDEIREYVATGECLDKAGGYAIQGIAGMFIDRIEGSYSNVVGLPTALLRSMLLELSDAEN